MIEYFAGLINLFIAALQFDHSRQLEKAEAITNLRAALRATIVHIRDFRVGEFGDINFVDQRSNELSTLWSNAARSIRPFDPILASTLEDKSDYWSNPYGFRQDIQDGQRRFDYRIRLDEVEHAAIRLENSF